MMRHRLWIALLCACMLSGCGLKRNLELPGHEKHTTHPSDDDDEQKQTPAAPAPSPAMPPVS